MAVNNKPTQMTDLKLINDWNEKNIETGEEAGQPTDSILCLPNSKLLQIVNSPSLEIRDVFHLSMSCKRLQRLVCRLNYMRVHGEHLENGKCSFNFAVSLMKSPFVAGFSQLRVLEATLFKETDYLRNMVDDWDPLLETVCSLSSLECLRFKVLTTGVEDSTLKERSRFSAAALKNYLLPSNIKHLSLSGIYCEISQKWLPGKLVNFGYRLVYQHGAPEGRYFDEKRCHRLHAHPDLIKLGRLKLGNQLRLHLECVAKYAVENWLTSIQISNLRTIRFIVTEWFRNFGELLQVRDKHINLIRQNPKLEMLLVSHIRGFSPADLNIGHTINMDVAYYEPAVKFGWENNVQFSLENRVLDVNCIDHLRRMPFALRQFRDLRISDALSEQLTQSSMVVNRYAVDFVNSHLMTSIGLSFKAIANGVLLESLLVAKRPIRTVRITSCAFDFLSHGYKQCDHDADESYSKRKAIYQKSINNLENFIYKCETVIKVGLHEILLFYDTPYMDGVLAMVQNVRMATGRRIVVNTFSH